MKTGKSTMPTYDIRIEVVDLSRIITVLSCIYYVCLPFSFFTMLLRVTSNLLATADLPAKKRCNNNDLTAYTRLVNKEL